MNETKWSSLLARNRALILYVSIWIFDFGPVKLPGLSRNGSLAPNPRFTYTPSVLTNVSVEAKIVYCPFKLSTRSCCPFLSDWFAITISSYREVRILFSKIILGQTWPSNQPILTWNSFLCFALNLAIRKIRIIFVVSTRCCCCCCCCCL